MVQFSAIDSKDVSIGKIIEKIIMILEIKYGQK